MNVDYLAGFFDGEGSLSYCRSANQYNVCIAQCDRDVLVKIQEFLSVYGVQSSVLIKGKSPIGKRTVYYLQIAHRRRNIQNFLALISHRLVVKKNLAEDVCRFLKVYPAMNRKQIGMSVSDANRRRGPNSRGRFAVGGGRT